MRSARGQGTVEYLAVVLLVAFALGGGTAAVASAAGADIATAVPHEVLRALCIVSGGDCDRDRAPCDVDTNTKSRSARCKAGSRGCTTTMPIIPMAICTISSECGWYMKVPLFFSTNS